MTISLDAMMTYTQRCKGEDGQERAVLNWDKYIEMTEEIRKLQIICEIKQKQIDRLLDLLSPKTDVPRGTLEFDKDAL